MSRKRKDWKRSIDRNKNVEKASKTHSAKSRTKLKKKEELQ